MSAPKQSAGSGSAARRWRQVRVIWNSSAGQKAGLPLNRVSRDDLVALLEPRGLAQDVCEAGSPPEAAALAREAIRAGCDLVVAAGGDGTIAAVANELLRTEATLGVLPLGSVMNIPRSLGLPRELEGAVGVLERGDVKTIDVGEAKGRPFYETGSVGMNAVIFREAQRFDDGEWLSILRTVWVGIRYRPARMEIRLDDRLLRTRALMVTVSNGPYTGTAMTVAPGARLDDGKFDVRVFRRFSKWQLIRHLASIAFGRRRYAPEVSTYRSERVRIDSVHPLPCRVDSHDLGTTPVEFLTQTQVLRVVVPPPEQRVPGAALPADE